jgi:hypothetical protein
MAAGLNAGLTLANVNSVAGGLASDLNSLMNRIQQFQIFLAATDLTAAPISMTSADQAVLKSAFTDADKLRQIYQGLATQTPAYDFRTFVKQVDGFGL